jgi:phage gpG-like protein
MSDELHFELDTSQFDAALAELDEVTRGEALREAIDAGGFALEAEIKLNINDQGLRKTGNLINSIQKRESEVSDTSASVDVGTNVIYAAIHEFGGIIKAKVAKYLCFMTDDGQWHKVKSVTMPARPFMHSNRRRG